MIVWLAAMALAQEPAPDRSAPPAVVPAEPLELPEPTAHQLRPGVLVHHLRVSGLRKSRVDLYLRRGPLEVDGATNPAFTAMAWIQDQATRTTRADDLAVFEDVNDLDVWTDSGLQLSTARLVAPWRGWTRASDCCARCSCSPTSGART